MRPQDVEDVVLEIEKQANEADYAPTQEAVLTLLKSENRASIREPIIGRVAEGVSRECIMQEMILCVRPPVDAIERAQEQEADHEPATRPQGPGDQL